MDITLRPMTPEERLYSYTQSLHIPVKLHTRPGGTAHRSACNCTV